MKIWRLPITFSEFGDIQHKAGRTLTHADVKDAQALLVRSVTTVNASLIENTALKYVGSATIGTDHLDIAALENKELRGQMRLVVMPKRWLNMSLQLYFI